MDQTVEAAVDRVTSLQCEGQTVEVKAARGGTPKLYETLSSFANQIGRASCRERVYVLV